MALDFPASPVDGQTYTAAGVTWRYVAAKLAWVTQTSGTITSHTHTMGEITDLAPAMALKANLASPNFSGVPLAPTATAGTNTTQIATTQYVTSAIVTATATAGDVDGPSSAVNDALPVWNGTSGKLLKDSGVLYSSLAPLASPTFTGKVVMPTPTTSAGLNIGAPSAIGTFVDGDVWMEGTNIRYRSSGVSRTLVPTTGATFTGKVTFPANATAASMNLAPSTASPSTPANGDLWSAATGLFAYINGTQVQFSIVGHTHTQGEITNLTTDLGLKANVTSPNLLGTPTAPTATAGTNTTQIATTAFVHTEALGRLATTGGTLTGNLVVNPGTIQISNPSAYPGLFIDYTSGFGGYLGITNALANRYQHYFDDTAYYWKRYDNAGTGFNSMTLDRLSGSITFGGQVITAPSTSAAGLHLDPNATADPSSIANGDIWMHTNSSTLRVRVNGTTLSLAGRQQQNVFTADQYISSTATGAASGPSLFVFRDNSAPAANDLIGKVSFDGRDNGATEITYSQIGGVIVTTTAGSASGQLRFNTRLSGTSADRFYIGSGMFSAGVTGGDKGAGTVNAKGYYIDGVDVINGYQPFNDQTGTNYTFALTDAGKLVSSSNAATQNFTVPPNSSVAFAVGAKIDLYQKGAGQLVLNAGAGVTLRSAGAKLKLAAQYSACTLVKIATDEWLIFGDLAA